MSLNGRVALVTGAGRGIGRAIAAALAKDGADIAVNYRRDDDAAAEAVAEIQAAGGKAKAYCASVDNLDEVTAMVADIGREMGPIGILINNAGIASRGQSVADTEPTEMERVMRVHAFGPFYLSKLVIPMMRDLGRGDIIMISSVATDSYGAFGNPYNMGKAAMEALAFTMAKEEHRHNIRTNIVAPPLVETDMGRRLVKARSGIEDLRELDAGMPFGHVCQPDDIANTVHYLVSDMNSYVNGQRIAVDGGGSASAPKFDK
ncbi:MAG: SDR family oxidoreductase [Alphaproteobacteria bacterium]|jgi:NAD(P)-dependent dehydrogenase (short-subunit alcohol dehydrogenase family)|nr:oxidoreductase [Rhodospirillaceae bacterium]MDP6022258.1 SDR family oxidoreductase [Alphaproteobacteria bacterium]MDP6253976.1 SDR family oxidoreductase [Alphaproteobacteria bacterium]MDP7056218.1 SDR family oxidoreductase [Alphaproteobacteria bacterium]MDP7227573.1 SDR family oxidoreductase [Alphaproteobacteria bacterium]|tara:strand:+ start:463 stop:1245 length:783 start_codon:yes stop_codon:yes gene_type:complete